MVLRPGAQPPTLEKLSTFLLGKGIAKTKLPERLELVDEMPLNPTGEIQKRELRARIAQILEQEQAPAGG